MTAKYRVVWRRRLIESDIAEWVAAAMEQGGASSEISTAMGQIDTLLSSRPEAQGESRGEFERVLIVPPLSVTFEIHEDESIVFVFSARYRPQYPSEDE